MTSTTDKTHILGESFPFASSVKTDPRTLVTGSNRGVGYDLVLALLKRYSNAVLYAGARDPASAHDLNELARKDPRVHVIKLVADDEESNKSAVGEVKKVTDRLDIVIANAGTSSSVPRSRWCSLRDRYQRALCPRPRGIHQGLQGKL